MTTSTRSGFHVLAILMIVSAGGWVLGAGPVPDVDLRNRSAGLPAQALAPATPQQAQALALLEQTVPGFTVRWSSFSGAPNRMFSLEAPISGVIPGPAEEVAKTFLSANLTALGLSEEDLNGLTKVRDYRTKHNRLSHLTFQQMYDGLEVFGARIRINVMDDGRVLNLGSDLVPDLASATIVHTQTVAARQARALAAADAGIEEFLDEGEVRLVYFPLKRNELHAAWEIVLTDARSPHVYHTLIDRSNGVILWRKNLTYSEHFPAHGLAYTNDGPQPSTPSATINAGVTVPRVDVPFSGIGFFPHDDDHFDWWAGNPRTTTSSNNVIAEEDRDGDNGTAGFMPTAMPTEDFSFTLDLTQDPGVENAATQNQSAAIVNLFYWNNRMHDILYRLGFDEAAGNFQEDNFGLGGAGGDAVRAHAQDSAGTADPNLCNAFFNSGGADGATPRMTMLLCDSATPLRDSALDNSVIVHEYGHGVHGRLLDTSGHQRMNEGWSDYFALSLLAEPDDDVTGSFGLGHWLANNTGKGIRRQAYSRDQSIFTRTYADITDGARCRFGICSGGASTCSDDDDCPGAETCGTKPTCDFHFECDSPPQPLDLGDCTPEVHNTGELWTQALWIAWTNMVIKYGFATGSVTMNQLVIDGMKIGPNDPTFLDSRDSILMADLVNQAGVNQCLLWDAFARTGMGVSALTSGVDDINPVEAFDRPAACSPNIRVKSVQDLGDVCDGETATSQLELFNTGTGELIIDSVEVIAGDDDITVEAMPNLPLAISPDAHVDLRVHCDPEDPGMKSATVRISSNDADQPQLDLIYTCNGAEPNIATVLVDNGDFGDVCLDEFRDLDLIINNSGDCDLVITNISSSDSDFDVAMVMSYPLTVAPGGELTIPIRFEPSAIGPDSAVISISSNDPDTPIKQVNVFGNGAEPDILVTGVTDFGAVCPEDTADTTISVCNVGLCNLHVTSASIDCPDFTIISNPFPATVSHDFCLDLVIRFTPTSAGPKQCTLTITSDDPDTPVVQRELTGDALLPSIDVPGDLTFPPEVVQDVDSCSTGLPFPVSSNGICLLEITDLSISENPDEYSLSGLPSFPILLEPGHIAGEGDLETVFAPDVLDRDRLGEVSVRYVSDPYTGTETTVTRDLCGEGVRTGARVLVTRGGVPLPEVKSIRLHRLVGNRNGNRLDSVDNVHNVLLQVVTPDSPCGPFQFHREYGTVTNPIQLATGNYIVSVMVRIDGKTLKKTVGFDVSSCDFNPNIVVDF